MVFTPPFTAIPGEKITSAGWNTSARDNLNHIWGVLGGNPGANNLVPVSSGASASVWQKVPDIALFDQKISQKNPYIADLNTAMTTQIGDTDNSTANAPSVSNWHIINSRWHDYGVHYAGQIAINLFSPVMYIRIIAGGVPGSWYRIWNAAGMGSGSGLDADSLRTLLPANGSGNIAINNGVLNNNLNAAMLSGTTHGSSGGLNAQFHAGLAAGNSSGQIPVSNGVQNTNLNAQLHGGFAAGNAAGNIPVNNSTLNTGLNAQFLNGVQSTGFAPAITTSGASSGGSTLFQVGTYQSCVSVAIPGPGTYLIMAAGDAVLNSADANVIMYIADAGLANLSNVIAIGNGENGTRPWALFAPYVYGGGGTTVSVGGQKGAGAGGSYMEQTRIRWYKIG